MEVMVHPASPPLRDSRFDSAAASPYATAPSSPRGRLAFLTAPPSPNKLDDYLPQLETTRLTGANPFDLFQHFSSAPASPRRAAAIYAHFAEGNDAGRDDGEDEEDDLEFQHRASYTSNASAVPFDWEEKPGTPKAGLGGGAANGAVWDTDFEFGTLVDKTAPEQNLTTADELFDKGKIRPLKPPKIAAEFSDKGKVRPLKPPPGLLDGGSAVSSPRSPMARGGMWSPRRRSRVWSGVDFDPFAAALLEATKAPSPLGGKEANGVDASGSQPKKAETFTTRPASKSAGWRKWRLSDLLLFRSSSEGRRVNKEPSSKCSPVQQPDAPVKKASAQPTMAKAIGKADIWGKPKKHAGDKNAAAAEDILGSVRLSPLQRLAKGFRGSSWYYGRGLTALGIKG